MAGKADKLSEVIWRILSVNCASVLGAHFLSSQTEADAGDHNAQGCAWSESRASRRAKDGRWGVFVLSAFVKLAYVPSKGQLSAGHKLRTTPAHAYERFA